MYPILLDWGPIFLPAWHTFYVLGALASLILLFQLQKRFVSEVYPSDISRIFAICYILGYFGARLLSLLIEEPDTNVFDGLLRFGPMTFYGGALAAFAGGSLYVHMKKLPFAKLFDISIPAALGALAFGRIGCFLNGDDFGKPLNPADGHAPWWSVTFPNLADGLPRYPVQLVESLAAAMLAISLIFHFRKLQKCFRPGIVGFIGVIGYAFLRFLIEFLRDDFRGSPLGNWVSTSQLISALILATAALTVPYWVRTTSKDSS